MIGKEAKRFLGRLVLFSLPLLVLFLVELFVLPIDYFTSRPWETLVPYGPGTVLPGAFYPEKEIRKVVPGELAMHTKYAVYREVVWHTDQYGYRNRPTDQVPEVVLIGDSNIAGVKLDQDEILSEVLQKKINTPVYSYAPAYGGLSKFVHNKRFQENPPKVVVVAGIERFNHSFVPVEAGALKEKVKAQIDQVYLTFPALKDLTISVDRVFKWPMYRYFKAKIERDEEEPAHPRIGSELFIEGEVAFAEKSPAEIARIVKVLEGYDEYLRAKGIRFIFLPIPNKENIYHDLFPDQEKPIFLSRLISSLREKGVEVIDTQAAFDEARKNGVKLYPSDDGHWSPEGVKITAELLAQTLRQSPPRLAQKKPSGLGQEKEEKKSSGRK